MIIELFGPPGAGKTTLAGALAARLRDRGQDPRLLLSYRPDEGPLGSGEAGARHRAATPAARRLIRPVVEMLSTVGRLPSDTVEMSAVTKLMRILPPSNVLWSIRMRQYLVRLARSWRDASSIGQLVISDQGFVQAVYSLALLSGSKDPKLIRHALDSAPKADLLVRLKAPRELVEARLVDRQRRQGKIERLFELGLQANLTSIPLIDTVYRLLEEQGRYVASVSSADPRSLHEAVQRIEGEVMARLDTQRELPAPAACCELVR